MKIAYWIQKADLSSQDFPAVEQDEAWQVVESFDWRAECERQESLRREGVEECPPGIGFVDGDRILHICPQGSEDVLIHFHYRKPKRILGLIPYMSGELKSDTISMKPAKAALREFYQGDTEATLRAIEHGGG